MSNDSTPQNQTIKQQYKAAYSDYRKFLRNDNLDTRGLGWLGFYQTYPSHIRMAVYHAMLEKTGHIAPTKAVK